MRISLNTGVWTGCLSLAGSGALAIAPTQQWIGYGLLGFAALLLIWGTEINGRHSWTFWSRARSAVNEGKGSATSWIPLHEVLRYLAYESQWADGKSASDKGMFDDLVGQEAREQLARGEVRSRGKLALSNSPPFRTTEEISKEFWINAFIQPHAEIVLLDDARCAAVTDGGGGPSYRAIVVSEQDVRNAWPAAKGRKKTVISPAVEELRLKIEKERGAVESSSGRASTSAARRV